MPEIHNDATAEAATVDTTAENAAPVAGAAPVFTEAPAVAEAPAAEEAPEAEAPEG